MSMKNSSDTVGNRTCNLPACSAVPQPTAPPRAPGREGYTNRNTEELIEMEKSASRQIEGDFVTVLSIL
jgi:hypothetical protein